MIKYYMSKAQQQNFYRKKPYTVPTCSDNGMKLNDNGLMLYNKYKILDTDDNVTCYAKDQSIPLFLKKINNIDDVVSFRTDFTNICIKPGHDDAGHQKRMKALQRERSNCEKQIINENIRVVREANNLTVNSYIENNRTNDIGFVITTNNVDYFVINRLNVYLKNKGLIHNKHRKLQLKIDAINKYFQSVKSIVMIGTVPVELSPDTENSRSGKTNTSGNNGTTKAKTNSPGTNTTRSNKGKSNKTNTRSNRDKGKK